MKELQIACAGCAFAWLVVAAMAGPWVGEAIVSAREVGAVLVQVR